MEGYVNLLSEFEPKGLVISPDSIFNIGKSLSGLTMSLLRESLKISTELLSYIRKA